MPVSSAPGAWAVSWGAAQAPGAALPGATLPGATLPAPHGPGRGVTIRSVVHSSIGGSAVRVTLSNAFGTAELPVTAVTVALPAAASGGTAAPGTLAALRFGGAGSAVIPPGAELTSDPACLEIPADADLLVSAGVRPGPGPVTFHLHARQESYVAPGDGHAADIPVTEFTGRTGSWFYLADVQVPDTGTGTVVAFGDSITDGTTSTAGANQRWPDYLARRLLRAPAGQRSGVLNAGISGNRVLLDGASASQDCAGAGESGLARLNRDVLGRAGVRTMIICAGINDIIWEPHSGAQPIIAGLRAIAARAHGRGIRVIGATLAPARGYPGGFSAGQESARESVNAWIRDAAGFDAVADFDAALRDPVRPERLAAAYDSGDHLHPNDHGFAAIASAIRLADLAKGSAER